MPHGGPHGPYDRLWLGLSGTVFLADGYNVIQVNFRGSGGFGRNFEEAGYLEWSGKMIDDIVEGAEFVISASVKNFHDRCACMVEVMALLRQPVRFFAIQTILSVRRVMWASTT